MLIHAPCVVSLTWHLADAQGQAIDDLTEALEFFYGGDDLLPKLEEALAGQQKGFEVDLRLEPEQGFGDYRAELVCFEARSLLPEHIEEGMQFDGLPEGAASVGSRSSPPKKNSSGSVKSSMAWPWASARCQVRLTTQGAWINMGWMIA